jgi:3-hydroxyacyl-CoA dehydrogenase
MYYADRLGLAHVRDRLVFYADRSRDDSLRPAPLLQRLAVEGRGFAQ